AVSVLMSRETLPDPFADAGKLPAPWREQGKGKRYRMAGDFRVVLAESSQSQAPVWKYTSEHPDDDWSAWGFDDSRWNQGPAAFGTALGDEFKVRSGRNGDRVSGGWGRTMWETPDLWLRTTIELPPRIRYGQIRWNYRADDSITVYVNG